MTEEPLDIFEVIMNVRMIVPLNKNECVRCGSIGTNLNTKFCLECIGERERERGVVGRVSSKPDTYSNEGIMNLYLEELRLKPN